MGNPAFQRSAGIHQPEQVRASCDQALGGIAVIEKGASAPFSFSGALAPDRKDAFIRADRCTCDHSVRRSLLAQQWTLLRTGP
jgi:hypothetical protein